MQVEISLSASCRSSDSIPLTLFPSLTTTLVHLENRFPLRITSSTEVTPGQQLHDVITGRASSAPEPPLALLSSACEILPSCLSLICIRAVSSRPFPPPLFQVCFAIKKRKRKEQGEWEYFQTRPAAFTAIKLFARLISRCALWCSIVWRGNGGNEGGVSAGLFLFPSLWLSLPLTRAAWVSLAFHNWKGNREKKEEING